MVLPELCNKSGFMIMAPPELTLQLVSFSIDKFSTASREIPLNEIRGSLLVLRYFRLSRPDESEP